MLIRNRVQGKIERMLKLREVSSLFVNDDFFCAKALASSILGVRSLCRL